MKCNCKCNPTVCAYATAVVGAFLIVGGLVWIMYDYTRPAPVDTARVTERRKILQDVRNADAEALYNPGFVWQDATKGIVRMPINQAMELALKLWQHPAEARTNLIARVDKAFYVPPPKPNPFD